MSDIKLKYYVLNGKSNSEEVQMFNIFNNWVLEEAVVKEIKKYLRAPKKYKKINFLDNTELYGWEAFVDELRSLFFWQEGGRVQYEIDVKKAFCDKEFRFDCYRQCLPNIEMIAREVIYQYKKQIKALK